MKNEIMTVQDNRTSVTYTLPVDNGAIQAPDAFQTSARAQEALQVTGDNRNSQPH